MAARASSGSQRRHRAPRSRRAPGLTDAGRDDAGSALLIESMIMALLVLIAVEFAAVIWAPGDRELPSRHELTLGVGGSLQSLADSSDAVYANRLERAVAEALQGNTTLFAERLDRALPPGTMWNAWLDTGQARLRLRYLQDATGEAVSADQLIVPSWGPILSVPQVQLLDATRSGLVLQGVPLHRGSGLGGWPGVQAETELQLPDGSRINVSATAPLLNRSAAGPGASLSLLSSGTHTLLAQPAAGNRSLYVGVQESQGRAIPAGTELRVRLPPGFASVAADAAVNPGWTGLSVTGNSTYGWVVTGNLGSALSNGLKQLQVNATPPATWGKVFLLEGALDSGKLGRFAAAYVAPTGSTTSSALPPGRGPWLTLPSNAPYSAAAEGGLVLAYPDESARTLTVTRVTLTPIGGATFASGAGITPASGWTSSAAELEWTGARSLANDNVLEWRFQVQASAPARDPSVPDALLWDQLNGYARNASWQEQPGVWRSVAGPANATVQGFATAAGDHATGLNATDRGAALTGSAAYAVSTADVVQASASDVARGAWESWLHRDNATVAPGGRVTFTWNLTRVVDELGVQVAQFKCYTSTAGASQATADEAACTGGPGLAWQFRHEAPTVTLRVAHPSPAHATGLALEGQVTGLAAQGSTVYDVPLATLAGTHVVELRAEFRLHSGSSELTQRVSLLTTYDVAADGHTLDPAPGYVLVVQAWLPEWS